MIHSRFLVPKYLTENSKDIHVLLRLIDLALNNNKSKSDDFVNILNPDKCPNQLLPLLASYVGYEYDYNETYDSNRIIIRSYKDMIKNKGNIQGIQLATSVAISMVADKSLIDAQELIDVAFYDYYYRCPQCGYIAYEPFEQCPQCDYSGEMEFIDNDTIVIVIEYPLYSAKSYDLIEAVRPAGTACLLYNGTIVTQVDTIGISDFVKLQSKFLNDGMSEVSGVDAVSGFTTILKEKPTFKYCEVCGAYSPTTADVCYKCGSELKEENNSSLRLLYRLYNDMGSYNSAVGKIIENIDSNNCNNNSDCVGIILRIHSSSDEKENIVDPITHKVKTVDWSCDFTQSFIFGLKPYANIKNENDEYEELLQYTISDILEKLSKSNNTDLRVLRNVNRNNYSYDLTVYYQQINSYDSNISTYYYENGYNYIPIYDINSESDFNNAKSLHNKLYIKDGYAIRVMYSDDDGTYIHYYTLDDDIFAKLYSINNDGSLSETDISNGNINDKYSFKLGKDTLPPSEQIDINAYLSAEDTQFDENISYYRLNNSTYTVDSTITQQNFDANKSNLYINTWEIKADGVNVSNEDEFDTFTDYEGKYIYVCRACNNVIPNGNATSENIDSCPICGGVITPNDEVKSTSGQLIDHTILQGSYLLDLYFGN